MGEKWKKWKTTVVGVLTTIVSVLFMLGVLTPEQKQVIDEATGELAQQSDVLYQAIIGVIGIVSGVINVFRAD